MEARDTVMSKDELMLVWLKAEQSMGFLLGLLPNHYQEAAYHEDYEIHGKFVAEAQAEITWKARQPEIDEAYEAGMREVVESYRRENPSRYKKYETWWQAFVKRKGL